MLCLRTEITISVYHGDHGLDFTFHTLGKLDGICDMVWGYISVISTSSTL